MTPRSSKSDTKSLTYEQNNFSHPSTEFQSVYFWFLFFACLTNCCFLFENQQKIHFIFLCFLFFLLPSNWNIPQWPNYCFVEPRFQCDFKLQNKLQTVCRFPINKIELEIWFKTKSEAQVYLQTGQTDAVLGNQPITNLKNRLPNRITIFKSKRTKGVAEKTEFQRNCERWDKFKRKSTKTEIVEETK